MKETPITPELISLIAQQVEDDAKDVKECKAQLTVPEIGLVEIFSHSGKPACIEVEGKKAMGVDTFIKTYLPNQQNKPSIKK